MAITRIITPAVTDDAVTLAKMAPGTDGNLITYDASGNPVAVATGSAGQVLTSAGAGAPPTFAAAGGITEADQWRLSTNFNGDASPIASNLERVDTGGQGLLGTGMSQSSGIFTFPSTGIWLVKFVHNYFIDGDNWYNQARIAVTTNNSSYTTVAQSNNWAHNENVAVYVSTYCESIIDVQNTTNVKVRFEVSIEDNNATTDGDNNVNKTYFTFIRLGDT